MSISVRYLGQSRVAIEHCPYCQSEHVSLGVQTLKKPVLKAGHWYNARAYCPLTERRIYVNRPSTPEPGFHRLGDATPDMYGTFVCPKCGHFGIITEDQAKGLQTIKCLDTCGWQDVLVLDLPHDASSSKGNDGSV